MLIDIFPKSHLRYQESPASSWLADFSDWLERSGYTHSATHRHVRRLWHILEAYGSVAPDAMFSSPELAEMFTSPWRQSEFRCTQRAFERFLIAGGRFITAPDRRRFSQLLDGYQLYLIEVRGLVLATTCQHIKAAEVFLTQTVPDGVSLRTLSVPAVERFVVAAGQRVKRQSLQHTVARLRAFLRFCYDHGELCERLDCIDTPRAYRDELPPRALAWDIVQELLRSIDHASRCGCRDHAMLYLMAHYGLRPSEIVGLTLASVDRTNRSLRVEQSKTRSLLVLPLSEEALTVLERYIGSARPGSAYPQLFLRARAPAGPLKHTAVCDIYQKYARLSKLPLQGSSSYSLRHTFAMRLLDCGIGIKVIGDLLGHHTLESTCVYLRLQTEALREVGLPVPSLAACVAAGRAI
jgi:integrase/recombinase XerD